MSIQKNDQAELKHSFSRVSSALARKPALGRATLVSTTRLRAGLACEIQEGTWRCEAGMPKETGGQGGAPTPGMLGRAALGSCLAIGYMLWASRRDVSVTNLEVEIQADSDNAGLFGAADVTPGYTQVRYCITIESTASEETILAMLDEAEQHSPWLDVYTRPIDCQRQVCIIAPEGV